jgi:transmembrane sensor
MKRAAAGPGLHDADLPPPPPTSPADEEAARWVMRMTSGSIDAQERAAFVRWRMADPDHEAALARMRAIWIGLDRALDRPVAAPRRRRRTQRSWALAASMLAAVAIGWLAMTQWRYDEVTGAGERRQIMLADGSGVLLGAGTAVDLRFDAQHREVELARGEAWFDVAPDDARAFIVRAGAAEVRVLGTRFAVRIDRAGPAVTVEQGLVEVRAGDAAATLGADQRIVVRDGALAPVQDADAARELAWRYGRLVFEGATLGEIARELNRHRSGTVLVAGAAARGERFNAIIDLDHVEVWLAGLDASASLSVVRLGPVVVIH